MKLSKRWKAAGCVLLGVIGITAASAAIYQKQVKQNIAVEKQTIQNVYTLEYQKQARDKIEEQKNQNRYTEEQMLILRNPFGTNTLSLYVYFETSQAAKVSYSIETDREDIPEFSDTPASETEFQNNHEFQVVGLVPGVKNTITFTVNYQDGSEQTFQRVEADMKSSGEEETVLQTSETAENASNQLSDGWYVILGNDSDESDFMYYYDNAGVLRGEIPIIDYRSHRVLFRDDQMYYSISETQIAAVNMLGEIVKIYDTGKYLLHHDYVFDQNGDLLVLASKAGQNTVQDFVIRIDQNTGEITGTLNLADIFGEYKEQFVIDTEEELDWMHINTIQWIEEETIILSSRETSSILKISDSFSSPNLEYLIGNDDFWNQTGYESLLLQKDTSQGDFPDTGGQHTVTYQEDSELEVGQYYLYLFNNNLGVSESRDFDWSSIEGMATTVSEGEQSYYYQYLVDEEKRSYKLVQSFAVPFSGYVSSVQEKQGNIIVDSGMAGTFGEYDREGKLLKEFQMELFLKYIYRVYKYDLNNFY